MELMGADKENDQAFVGALLIAEGLDSLRRMRDVALAFVKR